MNNSSLHVEADRPAVKLPFLRCDDQVDLMDGKRVRVIYSAFGDFSKGGHKMKYQGIGAFGEWTAHEEVEAIFNAGNCRIFRKQLGPKNQKAYAVTWGGTVAHYSASNRSAAKWRALRLLINLGYKKVDVFKGLKVRRVPEIDGPCLNGWSLERALSEKVRWDEAQAALRIEEEGLVAQPVQEKVEG